MLYFSYSTLEAGERLEAEGKSKKEKIEKQLKKTQMRLVRKEILMRN